MGDARDLLASSALVEEIAGGAAAVAPDELRRLTLDAGDVLIRQGDHAGELFALLDGVLRTVVRDADGSEHVVEEVGAGAVVGEVALVAGGRRAATVTAVTPCVLVGLTTAGLDRLVEERPEVGCRLTDEATRRLRTSHLIEQLAVIFPDLSVDEIARVAGEVTWLELPAGSFLFREGDGADAAYVVTTGRLRVVRDDVTGAEQLLGEVGRGELVGEIALIRDASRGATVFATRDTVLARLSRSVFEELLEADPRAMLSVVRTVVDRAERSSASRRATEREVSVALVAAHPSIDLPGFAQTLVEALGRLRETVRVSSAGADEALGKVGVARSASGTAGAIRLAAWLHDLEHVHDLSVFEADREWTSWTRRAVGQADRVIILVDAGAGPELTRLESQVYEQLAQRRHPRVTLLLLHPPDTSHPDGTARWLDRRPVDDHLHMRRSTPRDLDRVARVLAGRGVGVVLSGGGARGLAHIGAIRALREAGVPIDLVAGSSMGTAVGSGVAMDHDAVDEFVDLARATFSSVVDYTIPAVALLRGGRVAQAALDVHEERGVEDLWLPFLAVSTNLTTSQVAVHDRGSIAKVVRASTAFPGVLPPVVFGDEIHVDGGVLNNLPIDEMRARNPTGTVIAIDTSPHRGPRAARDPGLTVSGLAALRDRLLPGRVPAVPGPSTMILHASLAGAERERQRSLREGLADLYLDLDLPGCGLLEFETVDDLVVSGYETSRPVIAEWLASRTGLVW